MPSPQAIENRLQDGTIVFVESRDADGKTIPYLVSTTGITKMPRQLFGDPPGATPCCSISETVAAVSAGPQPSLERTYALQTIQSSD
jgi:hypothetical protein